MIAPLKSKHFKAIDQRIEILGQMDDRHQAALNAGDALSLTELAQEYASIGCPNLANIIMIEAETIGVVVG